MSARTGMVTLKVDGDIYRAKGNFTYNLGRPTREAIQGEDGIHGYREQAQVAYIEGEVTDQPDLSLDRLTTLDGVTITLELNSGKVIVLSDAWYAGDGNAETQEGNINVRFESAEPADEVR